MDKPPDSQLLDSALRALCAIGGSEGILFEHEWSDYGIGEEDHKALIAAVDAKWNEVRAEWVQQATPHPYQLIHSALELRGNPAKGI